MELWDQAKAHWGWLATLAGGAAGLLGEKAMARRHRSPSGDSWISWIGRRWNVERQNVTLRLRIKDLEAEIKADEESDTRREASHERERASWERERADMERYLSSALSRLDQFTDAAKGITQAHETGLLAASEPPSNGQTPPSATSSPSSKKSNG